MTGFAFGPAAGGSASALNITATTVIKAFPGIAVTVTVSTAGSAVGGVHDIATTGGVAAGNLIGAIPNVVGVYTFNWPCLVGITVVPPTGGTIAVAYI